MSTQQPVCNFFSLPFFPEKRKKTPTTAANPAILSCKMHAVFLFPHDICTLPLSQQKGCRVSRIKQRNAGVSCCCVVLTRSLLLVATRNCPSALQLSLRTKVSSQSSNGFETVASTSQFPPTRQTFDEKGKERHARSRQRIERRQRRRQTARKATSHQPNAFF